MEYSNPNFLDLAPEDSDPDRSGVVILPLPLDLTASWKRGTAEGPAAIIDASHHIERFDEELRLDPCRSVGGIATHPTPVLSTDPERATKEIHDLTVELIRPGRLLVALGGEHAVSYPLVRAHRAAWPELSVVHIDAHADMRSSYMGSEYNHACPMRRILELDVHVTSVGIRSMEESEAQFIDGDSSRIFLASEVAGRLEDFVDTILASLPSRDVYLTIDLDGLDPSVVPAVGTPVPGGLGWYETLSFVHRLTDSCRVIGADVVELCPRDGLHYADAAAARLVYKIISYWAVARTSRATMASEPPEDRVTPSEGGA
jgi:agmatinase